MGFLLVVAQRPPDALPDTLWYLGNSNGGAVDSPDGMIVFGLGRGPGTRPQFRDAGIEIVAGLVEAAVLDARDHDAHAVHAVRRNWRSVRWLVYVGDGTRPPHGGQHHRHTHVEYQRARRLDRGAPRP